MANRIIYTDDIVWLKSDAELAECGRYWLVDKVTPEVIHVSNLNTGKSETIAMDDVLWVFRPTWNNPTYEKPEKETLPSEAIKVMETLAVLGKGITREAIAGLTNLNLKTVYDICHRLSRLKYLSSRRGFYSLSPDGRKVLGE